jgi:Zn-dependent oligopeptidase
MDNLKKLNDLTLELEKSLSENIAIQNYLRKIENIVESINQTSLNFISLSDKLDQISKDLSLSSKNFNQEIKRVTETSETSWENLSSSIDSTLSELKKKIESSLNLLSVEHSKFSREFSGKVTEQVTSITNQISDNGKKLHTTISNFSTKFSELQHETDERLNSSIVELTSDLKKLHKELDESIKTRHDKHSSDIQLSFRNESTQIQRSMELAIKESTLGLEKSISIQLTKTNRQQRTLFFITIFLIIIGIISVILLKNGSI